jgi:protein dithiol oxidoreductase (disulfide-forming)
MHLIRLLLPLLLLTAVSAQAADAPPAKPAAPAWMEGVNYVPVVPAQPVSPGPGQIEVIDFFWYNCPHCFSLEPYLESWERSKPANVVLVRVPVISSPDREPAARAYYTAQALGILDKAHEAIFNEIHLKNDQLLTEADYERFFTKQFGISAKQFEAAWTSPAVDAGVTQARILATRYNINILGVPMLAVNGRWLTGGGFAAWPQVMQVVNFLIQKEQAAITPPAN